eukprot:g2218.t1
MAPTSVGIALKLLVSTKTLGTNFGQMIVTAAFIDDVFSLLALVLILNLASGDLTVTTLAAPLAGALGLVAFGVISAVKIFPALPKQLSSFHAFIFKNHEIKQGTAAIHPKDEFHLFAMVGCLVAFGYLGSIVGSHLLGAFVAGMCFTNVPRSGLIWKRQMKRIANWLVKLFFAATVGFSIPVDELFKPSTVWKGILIAVVPCILGKLLSGVFMPHTSIAIKFVVGCAMVGRGEFSFFVAQTALTTLHGNGPDTMITKETYAVVMWGFIVATIFAPLAFKRSLEWHIRHTPQTRSASIGGGDSRQQGERFVMRIIGQHHTGLLREVMDQLHDEGMDVLECHAETDGITDADAFIITPRHGVKDVDDEKLHEIAHNIKDVINDPASQVVFEPIDTTYDYDRKGILEIKIIGDHHPDILHEIVHMLHQDEHLDIEKMEISEHFEEYEKHVNKNTNASDEKELKKEKKKKKKKKKKRGESKSENQREILQKSENDKNSTILSDSTSSNSFDDSELSGDESDDTKHRSEKDFDIFYCRDSDGQPISATRRAEIREKLHHIFEVHELKGEAMLKMVHPDEAICARTVARFQTDESVLVVHSTGKHHPDVLHQMCDILHEQGYDVVHAEMDHHGTTDDTIFHVASKKRGHVPSQVGRRNLRNALAKMYRECKVDSHISVRPLVLAKASDDGQDSPINSADNSPTAATLQHSPRWRGTSHTAVSRRKTPSPKSAPAIGFGVGIRDWQNGFVSGESKSGHGSNSAVGGGNMETEKNRIVQKGEEELYKQNVSEKVPDIENALWQSHGIEDTRGQTLKQQVDYQVRAHLTGILQHLQNQISMLGGSDGRNFEFNPSARERRNSWPKIQIQDRSQPLSLASTELLDSGANLELDNNANMSTKNNYAYNNLRSTNYESSSNYSPKIIPNFDERIGNSPGHTSRRRGRSPRENERSRSRSRMRNFRRNSGSRSPVSRPTSPTSGVAKRKRRSRQNWDKVRQHIENMRSTSPKTMATIAKRKEINAKSNLPPPPPVLLLGEKKKVKDEDE